MKTKRLRFKKELFQAITYSIKKRLAAKGVREEDILKDFERFRKAYRVKKQNIS